MERVTRLSSEKAVIFTSSMCPMCHTVTSLFSDLGVGAVVHELDKDPHGRNMERDLTHRLGRTAPAPVPVVFIGGRLVGSTNRIISLHLGGKLMPMLKGAGAIWLCESNIDLVK